jgi:hypothetical protein
MLDFNMEMNAGLDKLMESTVKDQTVNVIWTVKKTDQENVVDLGDKTFSNLLRSPLCLLSINHLLENLKWDASKMLEIEI